MLIRKFLIVLFILKASVLFCESIIKFNFEFQNKLIFQNVNKESLVNINNVLDLDYVKYIPKTAIDFFFNIPGYFMINLKPYFYVNHFEDKYITGLEKGLVTISNVEYGLELDLGKYNI